MNILSTVSSATNLNDLRFNNERLSGAFSNGRKIKESPPHRANNISSQLPDMLASELSLSKKSITRILTDRIPEITTPAITIMDSGQKLDMETAWGGGN